MISCCRHRGVQERTDGQEGCFNWLEAGMGLAVNYVQHLLTNKQKHINFLCKTSFPRRKRLA